MQRSDGAGFFRCSGVDVVHLDVGNTVFAGQLKSVVTIHHVEFVVGRVAPHVDTTRQIFIPLTAFKQVGDTLSVGVHLVLKTLRVEADLTDWYPFNLVLSWRLVSELRLLGTVA